VHWSLQHLSFAEASEARDGVLIGNGSATELHDARRDLARLGTATVRALRSA
jgi:hypothetical protein